MTSKAAERRKQLFLGELPEDFLRVGPSTSDPATAQDEQAAWALQQQLNAVPAQAQGVSYFTGFVPPDTRGRLSVTVASAKLARNYGLVRMDPYCRLRIGNTVFETPTDTSGGKSPKWNRTVHCYLPNGEDTIYLEIFDERAFTTDERIAWSSIPLPEAIFSREPIDEWYQMSGKEGDGKEGMVNLRFNFSPLDSSPISYVPQTHPGVVVIQTPGVVPVPQHGVQPVPGQLPAEGPPVGPLFTDEDVAELGEMFPNMDKEVIRSVLDEKRGNKDAAINALLAIGEA